jgi:hypothetical protein
VLTILNLSSTTTVSTTYHYAKFDRVFGSTTTFIDISPKYNNRGDIDNRYIMGLGRNADLNQFNIIVMIFQTPLVNLPPAGVQTPPFKVIPYGGFKSDQLLTLPNDRVMIKTDPDFPNLMLTAGFINNQFSIFEIKQDSLVLVHLIGFPKYYKEGKYIGDAVNILVDRT